MGVTLKNLRLDVGRPFQVVFSECLDDVGVKAVILRPGSHALLIIIGIPISIQILT